MAPGSVIRITWGAEVDARYPGAPENTAVTDLSPGTVKVWIRLALPSAPTGTVPSSVVPTLNVTVPAPGNGETCASKTTSEPVCAAAGTLTVVTVLWLPGSIVTVCAAEDDSAANGVAGKVAVI